MKKSMSAVMHSYFATALWSSTDDEGQALDDIYSVYQIADSSVAEQTAQVLDFLEKAGTLPESLDIADVSHDFWLTRNGHGAGFWDGDYPDDLGEALTRLSTTFGECRCYVGDDGLIYFE